MSVVTAGPYRFSGTDARRTARNVGVVWSLMTRGVRTTDLDALANRTADRLLTLAGEPDGDPGHPGDPAERLGRVGRLLEDRLAGGHLDATATAAAMRTVMDLWETASDLLRSAGHLPPTASGRVTGLHVSGGGLPKLPVDRLGIGFRGVDGDRQASRLHHGRPWQALCIWSAEVIESLQADGHPIRAGAAGENVTIRGIPWPDVRPGTRLRIGSATALVSAYALPCAQNRRWFSDGDVRRIHHERGDQSRVYATVLVPGTTALGDPVILEPAA